MVWTNKDAAKHAKGLSDSQSQTWARVANVALARCIEAEAEDPEKRALAIANAAARSLYSLTEAAIAEIVESEMSHEDERQLVQNELRVGKAQGSYCWIRSMFDGYCVYEEDAPGQKQRLYKRAYSVLDGKVTLGEAIEVRIVTTYEPVKAPAYESEREISSDLVPLIEKGIGKDGSVRVKLIAPGWGSSGHYSEEMLRRDGPKVFTKGTQMFMDHPTESEDRERPERSVKDLAAVLSADAAYESDPKYGPGLYAPAKVAANWAPVIEELAPHIGTSIRALGRASKQPVTREGKTGPDIEALVSARSVDFVTKAGAGGRIAQLFEAARSGQVITNDDKKKVEEGTVDNKELEEAKTKNATLEQENARLREGAILREAKDLVSEAIAKTDLPDITKARLVETLAKNPPTKDGKLDLDALAKSVNETVKGEREYIARLTGKGEIKSLGGDPAPVDEAKTRERFKGALKDLGFSDKVAESASAPFGRGN